MRVCPRCWQEDPKLAALYERGYEAGYRVGLDIGFLKRLGIGRLAPSQPKAKS